MLLKLSTNRKMKKLLLKINQFIRLTAAHILKLVFIVNIFWFFFCVLLIELILILGSMTDSVCTAYESRKQRNDSSSTIKGTAFTMNKC